MPYKDPAVQRAFQQKRQQARRAAGLCACCKQPAVPGRTRCAAHVETTRVRNAGRRRKGRRTGHGREKDKGNQILGRIPCRISEGR